MIKAFLKRTKFYSIYRQYVNRKFHETAVETAYFNRGSFVDEFIPKNSTGAEIGVLKGEFTEVLLSKAKPQMLHLIDPWYQLGSYWSWTTGNQSTVEAVIEIHKRFKPELGSGKMQIHIGDDQILLPVFPDEYFDWVYLDSSHTYEDTVTELVLLSKKVKKSGVICGDDWQPDPSHKHHGVCKAIREFVEINPYKIIYADKENLQWALKYTKD